MQAAFLLTSSLELLLFFVQTEECIKMTFCGNPQYVSDDVDRAQLTFPKTKVFCYYVHF